MQQGQNKHKRLNAHFPVTKIKKIIQENQEIGKLSNLVPPLVQQALQYFLTDLIHKSEEVAAQHGSNKLTPAILKHALISMNGYEFMKDALDDVQDEIVALPLRKSSSRPRKSKSEDKGQGQKVKEKRGRKKVKIDEEKQEDDDDVVEVDPNE